MTAFFNTFLPQKVRENLGFGGLSSGAAGNNTTAAACPPERRAVKAASPRASSLPAFCCRVLAHLAALASSPGIGERVGFGRPPPRVIASPPSPQGGFGRPPRTEAAASGGLDIYKKTLYNITGQKEQLFFSSVIWPPLNRRPFCISSPFYSPSLPLTFFSSSRRRRRPASKNARGARGQKKAYPMQQAERARRNSH